MKLRNLHATALLACIAFSACAEKAEDGEAQSTDAIATTTSDAAASGTAPTGPMVTALGAVGGSGIDGEATATHTATDVTVALTLKNGAKADVTYPAHIHTGTCEAGGPVAVELSPVTNLQSTKTVPASSLPASAAAYVQVHDPSGKPVACGNMTGHGAHSGAAGDTTQKAAAH